MDEFVYEILKEQEGIRVDKFLADELTDLSRSYIQKLLKEGMVTIAQKTIKASFFSNSK